MTADQWKAVESAFNEALEVPESERSIFLESCCPDPHIRLEVRKLLDHVKNDSFLESQVLDQMRDRAIAQVNLSGEDRQLVEHLTGTLVAGRYRVIRLLGRGGQSIVFLAADQRVGERTVALKVLDSEVIDDGGLERRFRREITILGKIAHPGVVAAHDCGQLADGRPFLVMDFVDGITLRERMRSPISKKEIAEIIRQVGGALAAAHRLGIVHRDLKPENIMIERAVLQTNTVKLIDFGIAKVAMPEVTVTTNLLIAGTKRYMAPEQLLGLSSAASDIFSFGVVCFELLTGSLPYGAAHCLNADAKAVPFSFSIDGQVAPAVRPHLTAAIALDPVNRPPDAEVFGNSVATALLKEPSRFSRYTRLGVAAAITAICLVALKFVYTGNIWPRRVPVIETVAGTNWKFSGDGLPALNVALGRSYGVACDRKGNVYETDFGNRAIVRVDSAGILHVLAGPDSTPENRLDRPAGLALDPSGAIYFGDRNRVRKLLPNGEIVLVAGNGETGYSGDGSRATGSPIGIVQGIALAGDGTVMFSEWSNDKVRRVDSAGLLQTVAGDGVPRFRGDGGPAKLASLQNPTGLALDSEGNLFIADMHSERIREVTPNGMIKTIAGHGVAELDLECPTGVAVSRGGALYIADPCKRKVLMVRNGTSSLVGGVGSLLNEPSGDGQVAIRASFDEWSLAVDDQNSVLVSSPDFGHIYRISGDGVFSTLAGSGGWRTPRDGTAARKAAFNGLLRVAVDRAGRIFLTELGERIYRIDQGGTVTRIAGMGHAGFFPGDTKATESLLSGPQGLRARVDGSLVFADELNNLVRELTTEGVLRTIAGKGEPGYQGDGGPAVASSLNHPSAVCLDASSAVFIADTNNNRIRKVGADGKIQLVAGNGVAGYSGDAGLGTLASLNRPAAIEMSPDGDLYIADTGNHRIRRLSHGVIATIAGDGVPRFAGDGGPAVKASLISPSELALGSYGALYVLDRDSARIRRIDLVSGIISTVAGNGDHTTSGDGDSPLKAGLGAPQGLAVDSHDDLYVTDSQSSRLRVIHLSRQKSLRSIFFAR